ncbi:CcmD family protein [Niastella sp. OAS944]|uniref:CcmD family protein n=1 Tax=Niastella sp. OAS944 TaxID=2664089 RepID=UPI003488022E|nr:putative oligopeptide transporter (OPT) family protein [Chitinophagaceae bacterium OAS944]
MKQLIVTLIVLFVQLLAKAQDSANHVAPTPTGLAAGNKIYVVMAVAITILVGLFLYVIRLDRKISMIEKQSS